MTNPALVALLAKLVDEKLSELPRPIAGPRGFRGEPGTPGKDFNFSEHEEQIKSWVKDFSLKFEDLSEEEIELLRGPRGERGESGRDGKDGRDGRNFSFSENEPEIKNIIELAVQSMSESLKMKFSDLDEDEINQLRGPRGRDGRPGRDFVFEDHEEFFKSLKPKFSDFTEKEIENLRLKFSDLSDSEKETLKLRFEDLSFEDRMSLKGVRGQRGRQGRQGDKGEKGDKGDPGRDGLSIRGLPGMTGPRGFPGVKGEQGNDGQDAPYVIGIDVKQEKNYITFIFKYSDGNEIRTNRVTLPQSNNITYISNGGGGSSNNSSSDVEPELPSGIFNLENNSANQVVTGLLFDPAKVRSAKVEWSVYRRTTGIGAETRSQAGSFYVTNDGTAMVLSELPESGDPAGTSLEINETTGQVLITADNFTGTIDTDNHFFSYTTVQVVEKSPSDEWTVETLLDDTLNQKIKGLLFGSAVRSARVDWSVYRKSNGIGGQTRSQRGAFYITNEEGVFSLTDIPMSGVLAGIEFDVDGSSGQATISSDDNGGIFSPSESILSYRVSNIVDFSGNRRPNYSGQYLIENDTADQNIDDLVFGNIQAPTREVEWTVFRSTADGMSRCQSGVFYATYDGSEWALTVGPSSGDYAGADLDIDSASGQVLVDTDENGGTYLADDSIFIYRILS